MSNFKNILFKAFFIFFSFLISSPNTCIFFDLYSKFEIFISKQKTFEFEKYFIKAAADAPA